MAKMKVPRTWPQLRLCGQLLRAFSSSTPNTYHTLLTNHPDLVSQLNIYLTPFYSTPLDKIIRTHYIFPKIKNSENFDNLIRQLIINAKLLGPAGFIALADLDTVFGNEVDGVEEVDEFGLLLLFVHVIILYNANNNFKMKCVGVGVEEEGNENEDGNLFPEIFPEEMNGRFGLGKMITYVGSHADNNSGAGQKKKLSIQGTKMGQNLMIIAQIKADAEPKTISLKVGDYITNRGITSAQLLAAANDLSPNSVGLSQFMPRAAATQLANVLSTEILDPFFATFDANTSSSSTSGVVQSQTENENRRNRNENRAVRPIGPVGGRNRNFIDPFHYGDDDLFPNLSGQVGGGGLLGPGHNRFPRPNFIERPRGVPRGARFDPFMGPPRGTNGRNFGDPNPDHMPPPDEDDDDGFGLFG